MLFYKTKGILKQFIHELLCMMFDTNRFQVKCLTIENILTFFHIKCFWSDSFLTENGRNLRFSQDVSPTEINQCWKYFKFVYLKAFASLNAAESGSRVNYSISLVPGAQLQVFFMFIFMFQDSVPGNSRSILLTHSCLYTNFVISFGD